MLGEFLGLTGVSAALLDTNLSRYSAMLNNPLDSFRISKFRLELEYLIDFLDNKVKVEYSSPELRKLLRRSDLVRNNSVLPLKKAYNIDIEGMNEEAREELAKKLDAEVREIAERENAPKSIVNSFVIVDTNERITLSPLEIKVVEKFKSYYSSVLRKYERMCSTDAFREITVFGEKLHNIAVRSPLYLLSLVSAPSINREEWVKKCLEWTEIIKTHFDVDSSNRGTQEVTKETVQSSLNFSNYILTVNGLDPMVSNVTELSEETQYMVDLFDKSAEKFSRIVSELSKSKGWRSSYSTSLIELYYRVFRLDHDPKFISEALLPEDEQEILDLDEVKRIYDRLNSIGLYLFHFNNTDLFLDSLSKITFSSERTVIDPDRVIHGYTFRSVVEDIENYCYSMMPIGSELEEVV